MADLKKKFIDILFEDEDVEEDDDLIQDDFSVKKSDSGDVTINAKDILYHKTGSSAFINLDESISNSGNSAEEKQEEYEMSSQISPIFGLLKENKKKVISVDPDIVETQTNKPTDSHLDIITSPIYGYANKEDAQRNNYNVRGIMDENEDEELHNLFDHDDKSKGIYDYDSDPSTDEDISLFRLFGENK